MIDCYISNVFAGGSHLRIEKEEESRYQQQDPGKRRRNVTRLDFALGHSE